MEDAVTLSARHFIQMWQHLKCPLEEFAQIKLKSMFMPHGCKVLHLKINVVTGSSTDEGTAQVAQADYESREQHYPP